MNTKVIRISGARQHNLKNLTLDIPRDQLVVVCGPSGSGKSTLAFDIVYAEGQRRYVESLSAYARQFLPQMNKPAVDLIEGLTPAISLEQQTVSKNPRSTVGTVTEIYDFLRVFYARLGVPHCPECGDPIQAQTSDEIIKRLRTADPRHFQPMNLDAKSLEITTLSVTAGSRMRRYKPAIRYLIIS